MKGGRVRIDRVTHVPSSALASGHGETWCQILFLVDGHSTRRVSDTAEVDCMACIAENVWKGF
jgi:hypothetical protein